MTIKGTNPFIISDEWLYQTGASTETSNLATVTYSLNLKPSVSKKITSLNIPAMKKQYKKKVPEMPKKNSPFKTFEEMEVGDTLKVRLGNVSFKPIVKEIDGDIVLCDFSDIFNRAIKEEIKYLRKYMPFDPPIFWIGQSDIYEVYNETYTPPNPDDGLWE